MKFTIVVVMLALAMGTQASIVPLGWAGSAYTAVSGPTLYSAHPGLVLGHAPAVAVHAAPLVVAPHLIAAEGTYVAKTRGAVHVAPLPGHLNSAASVNLAPAPGTF